MRQIHYCRVDRRRSGQAGKCITHWGLRPQLVPKGLRRVKASTKFYVQELNAWVEGAIGEQIEHLRPEIGIVTTIGSDHYTVYRSLEATAREKGLLVESLPPGGVAILNGDDPHVKDMAVRTRRVSSALGSPQMPKSGPPIFPASGRSA